MHLVTGKGDIDSVHAMPRCYATWTLRKNRMSTHLGLGAQSAEDHGEDGLLLV